MAMHIYKNNKTYSQELPLDGSGTINVKSGEYVQGDIFINASINGLLEDTGYDGFTAITDPLNSNTLDNDYPNTSLPYNDLWLNPKLLVYRQTNYLEVVTTSTVLGSNIVDGTIVAADLATSSVIAAKIADGNVINTSFATSAIEAAAIKDGDLTGVKVHDIHGNKFISNTVTEGRLADGSIASGIKIDTANCTGCTVTATSAGIKVTIP